MKICLGVPVFNHRNAVEKTLLELAPLSLPCVVVDDGSDDGSREVLDSLAVNRPWLQVYHRETNGGKGAAVKDIIRIGRSHGFTHLLLLDADGQHDVESSELFLKEAALDPDAVIIGQPIFDDTAPLARRLGREISNVLACVETLSLSRRDILCGYRLYPIHLYAKLIESHVYANRMGFDIEALIRMSWAGARIVNVPTKVIYPRDGVSHFRYVKDNVLIAGVHTRLLFEMLVRSPLLLSRGLQKERTRSIVEGR